METWLLAAFLFPLLGSFLVLVLPAGRERAIRGVAIAASGLALVSGLCLLAGFDPANPQYQFRVETGWLSQLGIGFRLGLDGISLPLVVLTGLVGFAAVLVSADIDHRHKEYYFLLLLVVAAAMGAFASLDLFFFYFFCELATVPKYLLVGVWGRQPDDPDGRRRRRAALQLTLYITAGALAVLVGLLVLYTAGGHRFGLPELQEYLAAHPLPAGAQVWLFGLLLLGFGIWASMWPFHSWAPPAYAAAPTAANMLFAGVLKNLGAYGLIRVGLTLLPAGARYWAAPLAVLATVNILYAGWVALRQRDWNLLLAYSSISHAGYLLLGVASLNAAGLSGAVLFMFAHGAMTALIFSLVGLLYHQSGRRGVADFSGLARRMPFLGVCMVMAVMASIGMAGFANFASEVLVFIGSWQTQSTALRVGTVAAVWGLVLTATYLLRALRTSFFGPPLAGQDNLRDPRSAWSRLPYVLLIAALLGVGLFPRILTDPIQRSASVLVAPYQSGTAAVPLERIQVWAGAEAGPPAE
jgi:NADH-quinone oxidoreductase subunit M